MNAATDSVDSAGMRWHPRVGDRVCDRDSDRVGVVLSLHQTANAPAYAMVAFLPRDGASYEIFECDASALVRDTSEDVLLPSFDDEETAMDLETAASILLSDITELALFRVHVDCDEALIGVLEVEAIRARRLGQAHAEAHRYDLAAREGDRFRHFRRLRAAVSKVVKSRPCVG